MAICVLVGSSLSKFRATEPSRSRQPWPSERSESPVGDRLCKSFRFVLIFAISLTHSGAPGGVDETSRWHVAVRGGCIFSNTGSPNRLHCDLAGRWLVSQAPAPLISFPARFVREAIWFSESPRSHYEIRVFPDTQALATQFREVVRSRWSGVGFTATAERCRCDQLFKRPYGHDWPDAKAILAYDKPQQRRKGEHEGRPFAIRPARVPSRPGSHWPRPRCATNIRTGVSRRDEGEQARQVEAV